MTAEELVEDLQALIAADVLSPMAVKIVSQAIERLSPPSSPSPAVEAARRIVKADENPHFRGGGTVTQLEEAWDAFDAVVRTDGPIVARALLSAPPSPDLTAVRREAIEEAAAVADLVCKANFMERGGLLVDKLVPRIRALSDPPEEVR